MTKEMMREIEERIGGVKVEETTVVKNNGVVMYGVQVRKEGDRIAPTIYINDVPDADVVDYVVNAYESCKDKAPDFDVDKIFTSENVLANVYPQLIGSKQNQERLSELIHTPYMDMDIIYRVMILDGNASFIVSKSHAENLNLTEDELYYAAIKNIKGQSVIKSMGEIMCELAGVDLNDEEAKIFESPMKVVSNKSKVNGASVILDEAVLVELYDKLGGDFYILPSSIHEVLAVPVNDFDNVNDLRDMVRQVNDTELRDEEILTYSVYVYRDGQLEVA